MISAYGMLGSLAFLYTLVELRAIPSQRAPRATAGEAARVSIGGVVAILLLAAALLTGWP